MGSAKTDSENNSLISAFGRNGYDRVRLSSCHLTSRLTGKRLENSGFDIKGGRSKMLGIPFHGKFVGALYLQGQEYAFDFSKLWTCPRTVFELIELPDRMVWRVKQGSRSAIMIVEVSCRKKDMIFTDYEAPDGSRSKNHLHCDGTGTGRIKIYNREGNYCKLVDDLDVKNVGCEFGEFENDRYF